MDDASSESNDSAMGLTVDSDFSDDEEDEQFLNVVRMYGIESRGEKHFRTRLIWRDHVDQLMCEGENVFARTYRMPLASYCGERFWGRLLD